MVNSSIENSGLLITRTLHPHKHQLRDFFNRHVCLQQLAIAEPFTLEDNCSNEEDAKWN